MRHLQLRRSNNVYNTIDEAKAALTGQSANLLDGEPIVVSYKDATATESNGVAQIIGFKIKKNNVDTIYTLNLQDIIKKSGRGTATNAKTYNFATTTDTNHNVKFDTSVSGNVTNVSGNIDIYDCGEY